MFKHLLLPTDGSPSSNDAVMKGIQLAKSAQARVTGIYVMPEFHVLTYRTEMLEDTKQEFAADCRVHARQYLILIQEAASQAGVTCDTVSVTSDHPFEAIIKTADEKGCDLIVMASHGRRGVRALLLGSETHKVLTHSKIPVLVYH
ncbi:universal stress protein [Variovorax sp. LjRoot84]|uniref:universal stress protein n=1 Tax=Variovorax sp. LjRoot84 TaxID=3342340 RepID=UPI003ECD6E90